MLVVDVSYMVVDVMDIQFINPEIHLQELTSWFVCLFITSESFVCKVYIHHDGLRKHMYMPLKPRHFHDGHTDRHIAPMKPLGHLQ